MRGIKKEKLKAKLKERPAVKSAEFSKAKLKARLKAKLRSVLFYAGSSNCHVMVLVTPISQRKSICQRMKLRVFSDSSPVWLPALWSGPGLPDKLI